MNSETLQDSIGHSLAAGHRVVLLVGPPGCGKSRILRGLKNVDIINVGRELGRDLLSVPREERAEVVVGLLTDLVNALNQQIIVLDNIELLLHGDLELDLWSALDELSGEKQLVVAWTGRVDGADIKWGEPGVPGHLVMSLDNCPADIIYCD